VTLATLATGGRIDALKKRSSRVACSS